MAKSRDSVHKSQFLKRNVSQSGESNLRPSAYQPSALPPGQPAHKSIYILVTVFVAGFMVAGLCVIHILLLAGLMCDTHFVAGFMMAGLCVMQFLFLLLCVIQI